jgi:hypothetical protein
MSENTEPKEIKPLPSIDMPIYLRKTPMIYTIINAHSRKDPDTGLIVHNQGLSARFTNSFPGQVCRWEPSAVIRKWVSREVVAGHITHDEVDEKELWLKAVIEKFIERHTDFQTGAVYKAPTAADIKRKLLEQKEALEAQLEGLADVDVTPEQVKEAVDAATEVPNPAVAKQVKGGGFHRGGSTSQGAR